MKCQLVSLIVGPILQVDWFRQTNNMIERIILFYTLWSRFFFRFRVSIFQVDVPSGIIFGQFNFI